MMSIMYLKIRTQWTTVRYEKTYLYLCAKWSLKVEFIERCWVDQRLFRFYLSLESAFSPAFSSSVQVNEQLNKLFTAATWTGEKLNKHRFISALYYSITFCFEHLSENKDNKIKKEKQMVPQVHLEVDLHVQKRNPTPLLSNLYHPY